jgi:hypothetical protein
MKYLESWRHWERLCKCSWFQTELEIVIKEIEAKWQLEAIKVIREIAKTEDVKQSFGAAKYIAEQGWKKKPTTRGRPSKAEIEDAKREAVRESTDLQGDLSRILEASKVRLVKK